MSREGTGVNIDATTFAQGLNAGMLHCRELGHVWRPHTASTPDGGRTFDRTLRCSSCRSLRIETLSNSGHILRSGYKYSDGYLATNVETGTIRRDVFRLESLTRWFDAASQPKAS